MEGWGRDQWKSVDKAWGLVPSAMHREEWVSKGQLQTNSSLEKRLAITPNNMNLERKLGITSLKSPKQVIQHV